MNELIKVTTNDNGDQLVSARELHRSLEIKTRFSLWVTQNFKPFRDGVDFTSAVSTTVVNNGAVRELQEYALSVEMAKHIAMVTGTSKGFEVRDYFISVEKAWNNPDMVVQRAMQIQQRKIDSLQIENAEMKPKALFADAVATSHTSILVGELAKIIKQNGVDIGANRLFHWLRANGFLIKRKGTDWNMPTQKSMELGLFEVKETAINRSDGSVSVSKTAKVTGKGQQYFINKFLNHELQLAYTQAMHHASNITYRNCTFEEVLTRNHLFDLCGSENITIDNCTFIGFNPVSGREYVEAIQTDYSWYAGLSYKSESERNVVDGLPTKNLKVINCRFLPVYNADKTIKYVAPNPLGTHSQIGEIMMENITFSNNTVIDGYTGVEAKGLITFYGISNLVIENNLFTRTRDTAVNDNQAINVLMIREVVNPADVKLNSPSTITMTKGYINNIRIDNNEFSNFTTTGNKDLIEISGMNKLIDSNIGTAIYNAEGIILTRNKFENNYPASANPTSQKYGRGSINVKVCYSIITGNTFKKCPRAVHCEFGKITISNNDVSDVFYVPIVVSSAISDISSNLFSYVISGIYITFYSVSDPSNSTISNNVFYGIYPNDLGFPTDYAGATISAIGSGKVSINGNLLTGNSQVANGIRTNNFNGKGIAANNVVSGYVTQLNLGSNVTNANNVI